MRLRCPCARRLEQMHGADSIRVDAADRIAKRCGHTRLAGKMKDCIRRGFGKQRVACVRIERIERMQYERRMIGDGELAQTPERVAVCTGAMGAEDRDAGVE